MIVSYDIKLVLLSLAVAILGAHTGLAVMARSSGTKNVPYKLRIAAAAVAIGGGIWAMHFIGMLALHLPVPIDYAVLPTLISLLIAVLITGVGLYSATSGYLGPWATIVGGVFMGIGIASMHYVGMEAVRAACVVTYSYSGVFASIVVGISASWLALWFIVRAHGHHDAILGAVILGLAISAMHYVGMLSTRFTFAEGSVLLSEPVIDDSYLACVVAVLTFLLFYSAMPSCCSCCRTRSGSGSSQMMKPERFVTSQRMAQALYRALKQEPSNLSYRWRQRLRN